MWGLVAGGALVLGAAVAWWVRVPPKVIAAGAILAMLAEMIPEAFEKAHVLTGLITALGFLTAFAVHLAGE
jgi:zinc transporter, ZIP family